MTCTHRLVVKRPEAGPGSRKPGEWFCVDCNAWWKEWRAFTKAGDPQPETTDPGVGL